MGIWTLRRAHIPWHNTNICRSLSTRSLSFKHREICKAASSRDVIHWPLHILQTILQKESCPMPWSLPLIYKHLSRNVRIFPMSDAWEGMRFWSPMKSSQDSFSSPIGIFTKKRSLSTTGSIHTCHVPNGMSLWMKRRIKCDGLDKHDISNGLECVYATLSQGV